MSVKMMGRIWELELEHNHAWVLMALADHADHEGKNIYPSIPLIAWKTGYSERQVQRIVKSLVESGILVVQREGGGRGKATVYRIDETAGHMKVPYVKDNAEINGDNMTPFKNETVTSEKQRVTSATLNGDTLMSPDPLLTVPIEPERGNARVSRATLSPKTLSKDAHGTRLTIEELPPEWRTFCEEQRPDLDPQTVWATFQDHWLSETGQKGRKANWFATWRNWVRREKRESTGSNGHVSSAAALFERHYAELVALNSTARAGTITADILAQALRTRTLTPKQLAALQRSEVRHD